MFLGYKAFENTILLPKTAPKTHLNSLKLILLGQLGSNLGSARLSWVILVVS